MNYKKEAEKQVRLLMKDCDSINPQAMKDFTEKLRDFCEKRNYKESYTEAILSHRYRYFLIIKNLRKLDRFGHRICPPFGNDVFQQITA